MCLLTFCPLFVVLCCSRPHTVIPRRFLSSRAVFRDRLAKFVDAPTLQSAQPTSVSLVVNGRAGTTVRVGEPLLTLLSRKQRHSAVVARVNDDESRDVTQRYQRRCLFLGLTDVCQCDVHQCVSADMSVVRFVSESPVARIAVAHTTAHLLGHALEQTFDGVLLHVTQLVSFAGAVSPLTALDRRMDRPRATARSTTTVRLSRARPSAPTLCRS